MVNQGISTPETRLRGMGQQPHLPQEAQQNPLLMSRLTKSLQSNPVRILHPPHIR